MPIWQVSEPMLGLWLVDTPVFYQPSRGPKVEFTLRYKNERDTTERTEDSTSVFSVGRNWSSPWRCFLRSVDGTTAFAFNNGLGGIISITNGGAADFRSRQICTMEASVPVIKYPTGEKDTFGYSYNDSADIRYFLTRREDPNGNALTFQYELKSGIVCLTKVVDAEGKENTIIYTNLNGYELISEVRAANGCKAVLQYDDSRTFPDLVSITDAISMSSSMVYSGDDVVQLITPYGTNEFIRAIGQASDNAEKALLIKEVGLRSQLYLYADTVSSTKVPSSYSSWRPNTTNGTAFSFPNTFDTEESNQRNTFYWGPRQYELLPQAFTNLLESLVLDTSLLASSNFLHAVQRHWMLEHADTNQLCKTLSFERTPSSDGTTPGLITWYDYQGKPSNDVRCRGTMSLPRFVAWKLPSGESKFVHYQRNSLGYPTAEISTYNNSSGSLLVRTNTYVYASNLMDMVAHTNWTARVLESSNVFNNWHQVVSNYNALGELTVYTYNANHQLTSIKRPTQLITTNVYDANGWLTNTYDYEVTQTSTLYYGTNSYTYTNGLVHTHTSSSGLKLTNTWDALNRLRRVDYPDGYITNSYDRLDLVRVRDRMGFVTSFGYDLLRRKKAETNALGNFTLYSYCTCDALESIQNAAGNHTLFYYDLAGRLTQTVYPDNYMVTRRYNSLGQITNTTDSAGLSITNWYNNQGLLYASSNAFGQIKKDAFDIENQVLTTIDANGVSVSQTYDDLGRVLTRTYPNTGIERFGYNARGMIAYTNELGTNGYVYDAAGRKTLEINGNGESTSYSYDFSGNLTNLLDGKNQKTVWKYDIYNRVTNKADHLGNTLFSYSYYPNGWLSNRVSAAKGTTIYRYDPVGNLTNIVYPVSPAITLKYDALDRLTNMMDGVGVTAYAFDTVGQLLSEDGPWDCDTVSLTYNN